MTDVVHTREELADGPRRRCPARSRVVMTMGALHDGAPRAAAGRPRAAPTT